MPVSGQHADVIVVPGEELRHLRAHLPLVITLNAELMKNVAEIGQLQLIWAASKSRPKKQ
ncbi:hypothetical protein ACFYXM_35540 [Streptomyces sp. NPDC002476]|uniref:hypothetical protein n=1 Tax=Streptomyces sp. NPDC002476 TaxID=3364648 RepID=UPI00367D08FA